MVVVAAQLVHQLLAVVRHLRRQLSDRTLAHLLPDLLLEALLHVSHCITSAQTTASSACLRCSQGSNL